MDYAGASSFSFAIKIGKALSACVGHSAYRLFYICIFLLDVCAVCFILLLPDFLVNRDIQNVPSVRHSCRKFLLFSRRRPIACGKSRGYRLKGCQSTRHITNSSHVTS